MEFFATISRVVLGLSMVVFIVWGANQIPEQNDRADRYMTTVDNYLIEMEWNVQQQTYLPVEIQEIGESDYHVL